MRLNLSTCICFLLAMVISEPLFAQKKKSKTFAEICDCPEFNSSRGYYQLDTISESKNEIEFRYGNYSMGYNSFVVIRSNKGKSQAFYYIAKDPSYHITIRKKLESPYNKYEITNAGLDTVLNKLLTGNIEKWQDPGFRNKTIMDLGVIDIQYKINGQSGAYRIQPPEVMIREHPEIQLYKDQLTILKIFTDLSNDIHIKALKKRGIKFTGAGE